MDRIVTRSFRAGPRRFARNAEGQVTVLVALTIVVLLLALALGTEWGFALTQRRLTQNAADAAALAGARLLASSVRATNTGNIYTVTEHEVYCRSLSVALANVQSFRPSSPNDTLTVEWTSADVTGAPRTPWTPLPRPAGGCPSTTGPLVNISAAFIRAAPSITYSSPLATLAGKPSVIASARAVARIVGTAIPLDGPSWPMVRHYNGADFAGGSCPNPCDPTKITPFTFWSSGNSPDITFNNFMGLVDFSRYSVSANLDNGKPACGGTSTRACVPQLITQWDTSGLAPNGKPDLTAAFGGGTPCSPPAPAGRWFTAGLEDPQNADKQCSLMNWIAYGFGGAGAGELSLTTTDYRSINTTAVPGGEFREAPSSLPNASQRGVCDSVPAVLPHPSCANGQAAQVGDWVEAAQTGNVGSNVASALRYFIDQHGVGDDLEHVRTGTGNGAPEFGKKVVIVVYLWDCAEAFHGTANAKNQWSLIAPSGGGGGSDCSDIHNGGDIGSEKIGRVHLFSVAPFTFYRGLVDGSQIRGYWGGLVSGNPGACASDPTAPGCQINPFSNAVFLVADD